MQTIRFTADLLKGVAHLAAAKDPRLYLNGVFVEARHHETRLVATDGKKLGIVRAHIENTIDRDISLTIPNSVLRQIQVRAARGLLAEIVIDDEGHYLRIPTSGLQYAFQPIAEKYVDYARVVPDRVSGSWAQFDPQLLTDFSKCALAITGKHVVPRITPNGDKGALVTIDGFDDFVGMIVPFSHPKASKPADISWFKTVCLSAGGQDHVNSRNAPRRRDSPALASSR
jgi:DNA polymerase III beta subunit, central domain